MNAVRLLPFFCLTAGFVHAADAPAADQVTAAAKKLAAQSNYSWKSTAVVPDSMPFKPGPTEGKTEKDGLTHLTMRTFGDNTTQVVIKGKQRLLTDQEGAWRSVADFENEEGPGRFMAMIAKGVQLPSDQVLELVAGAKELKAEGDAIGGALAADGLKKQFRMGEPKDPKGSVKFWLKDGSVTKYEIKVSAMMEFNGNEFDASRTTTVEIKDVGTTKLEVPEPAKKKLQ